MVANDFVLIADERVLAIPVMEQGEPLVDLRNQSDIFYGPSPEIEKNEAYTWVRQSILEKLKIAQTRLPDGLRLSLYEGLRTVALQKQLFDQRWKSLRALHPQASDVAIFQEVIKMVSPVTLLDGTWNVPPHATGAAVDVYLVRSSDRSPVDMGILAKDWMLDREGIVSKTHSSFISEQAKEYRKILSEAMLSVDFVNDPSEAPASVRRLLSLPRCPTCGCRAGV